ncbi:MAG: hypothetical protein HY690_18885 [Chloroflexi bacterium]|nr:hypothetical protein [Chloroflexota bacterium]
MPRTRQPSIETVERFEDVPAFESEAEEATFWARHRLGEGILAQMGPVPEDILPPSRPRTRPIAVRFDEDTLGRIKALAARKRKGYQTLLKEFVVERLYEEEKREGIVGR